MTLDKPMNVITTIGDPGKISDLKYYLSDCEIDIARAMEILERMLDSGVYSEEVQHAICMGYGALNWCRLCDEERNESRGHDYDADGI